MVVIMALASTRPIVELAEGALRRVANLGGGTPAAWWITILTVGPLLGSFITEPGAMTIAALLLARQFYDLQPSRALKYATLGPAVRERLDRRNADAFRCAAGPDGRPAMGVGHAVHARATSAGARRSPSWCPRWPTTPCSGGSFVLASRPAVPTSFRRRRGPAPGHGSCRFRGGSPRSTCSSSSGRSRTRIIRRCSSAGFLFFLGFDRATAAYSDRCRTSRRRCWSAFFWPVWSSTADCRDGGSHRCSRV